MKITSTAVQSRKMLADLTDLTVRTPVYNINQCIRAEVIKIA